MGPESSKLVNSHDIHLRRSVIYVQVIKTNRRTLHVLLATRLKKFSLGKLKKLKSEEKKNMAAFAIEEQKGQEFLLISRKKWLYLKCYNIILIIMTIIIQHNTTFSIGSLQEENRFRYSLNVRHAQTLATWPQSVLIALTAQLPFPVTHGRAM